MKRLKIFLATAFLAFLLVFFVTSQMRERELTITPEVSVSMGSARVGVAIADSPDEREKGLGGVSTLGDNEGMLFIFESAAVRNFWMKGMKIPIDIIWIKDDMVVGFEKNVMHPDSDNEKLLHYQPKTFVNYVLEVNSGFVAEKGIKIGDKVEFIF